MSFERNYGDLMGFHGSFERNYVDLMGFHVSFERKLWGFDGISREF